ncbi:MULTISPECIES: universal stress protein [Salegentibacter]|uniref:Universal stress protein n=1 Tax=Salegentibacter maritimus TaxID=2794347 RepID=A0ABS0TEK6_9FLAO|nr:MULTISPECIES: universal stress protein [Salegentibacter]MBE7640996.1 universal stress protein [Salegentibacter sp. BLCTC]MBI6116076.1 universal stress protein [Salegentibacter maritimus]MBI6119476.1 universal stress protein [Salegentibacter maritimus]
MKNFKNILVAIDFNDAVGELMAYAESIAMKFKAKIWVVHVAAPDPDFVGYSTGPQYIRDMRADELKTEHKELQEICKMFISEKIPSEALLIQGSTVETVLEEAKKLKADMLIVGTHKHSFFYNLFAESVSVELFKNAEIPVFAVPIEEKK